MSLILTGSSRTSGLTVFFFRNREMAVGNTFGATALSSYGGFWISFAIILTPGGFQIEETLEGVSKSEFADSFGLYLMVRVASSFGMMVF